MFEYKICNIYDKNIFSRQCSAIEQHIPNITNGDSLSDVDGSQLQIYTLPNGKKIKVRNSVDFGVSIESDVDIERYFN
ncbi:hypothetical protein [Ruminococcus sp.]|uniref:hypothetical protein n=1 Tax=Ruminococcus sp. TaxID=41978 RepID=UPI0025D423F6|nr:hypothetical protein [Ruminococcus sp.]